MNNEVILLTETRKSILEKREQRAVTERRVFSLDTLHSNAEILARCGGQAALVFRAIIGSYWMSNSEHRAQGFKIHPAFRKSIDMPDRQYQRATQVLEQAGYIEREVRPGQKMRFRLTEQGLNALAKKPDPT